MICSYVKNIKSKFFENNLIVRIKLRIYTCNIYTGKGEYKKLILGVFMVKNMKSNFAILDISGMVTMGSLVTTYASENEVTSNGVIEHEESIEEVNNEEETAEVADIKDGWSMKNGKWHFYEDGVLVNGVNGIDNKLYFFNEDGSLRTIEGWVEGNYGISYYTNSDGTLYTGWKLDDGKYYCMSKDIGEIARDYITKIDCYRYEFDENGVTSI